MTLSNYAEVSLPLAVWLAADGYDFHPGMTRSISATALLKPPRQILLKERLTEADIEPADVSDFIASRLGSTIHDGIEKAWTHNYASSMTKLGYPQSVIDKVAINPPVPRPGIFPIYLEQRTSRDFMGYKISGKFDMIIDGELHDFKSTSAYSVKSDDKHADYRLQGSIYRWLNRDKVTADHMYIHFIFTDWQKALARSSPTYPQSRLFSLRIELMPLAEIEQWIANKIKLLEDHAEEDETDLPFCADAELWRSAPKWKYFSDPAKAKVPGARSSKNFDSAAEAAAHRASKGGGAVLEVPGQVKACGYCPVFSICTQKDLYDHG